MAEQISLVDVSSSVSLRGEDSSNVALLRDVFLPDVAASDPAESSVDVQDEHSSDDSDNENEVFPKQNDFSQRRRIQNAQFEALLSKCTDADSNEAFDRAPIALSDGELSIAHLVKKQDLGNGMLDPREYQIELFERAKTQNTIAVLDTGSGKTLIAVLLLRHTILNELDDRANGKTHRVSFFLVDSVTLAYQQAAVLRNNIDQNVAHFFGAMGTDLWDKRTWDKHLQRNMVIVCTAEILNQCLLNSYVRMDQINLLIFDEAHHAKKDHPYARIIRDSYFKAQPSQRPRVFGMTASPIDTKGDITEAATRLETFLDSRIATTSKITLLREVVSRPIEKVWAYNRLEPPFATELYKLMDTRYGNIKVLEGVYRFAWNASSELGKWCSDRAWWHALADDVLPKLEGNINKLIESNTMKAEHGAVFKDIIRIREASETVKNYFFTDPELPGELSPKVQRLRMELSKHFNDTTGTKCIVFTQKRYTAKILNELFTVLNIPNLRPGVLIGVRPGDIGGMNITFRQQFLALVKFRTGEINCLFATSVAEEGLDIPDCNLVIRFDLYRTLIQYVQSRGRARHCTSTYAIMVEKDNAEHEGRLKEIREAENIMRRFCEILPEDRILHGNDHDLDSFLQEEEGRRTFTVKSTGAKLTYHSAIAILARYASSLQYGKETVPQVTYVVTIASNAYVCEVILPEKSPIRGLTGSPAMRKAVAKRSAAFDTCLLLRKNRLLDGYFNSIYHRRLPAMRNAKLAITCKRTNAYDMLLKPSIWAKQRTTPTETFYGIHMSLLPSKPLSRDHRPILLLTREKLPEFPAFSIYLDEDVETKVLSYPLKHGLQISVDKLQSLTVFTLRIFRDIFHKVYEHEVQKMPYWLAPAEAIDGRGSGKNPRDCIDWDTVSFVHNNDEITFTRNLNPESLVNRFIFDNWDGRFRYFTVAVADTLQPSDPPPPSVPRRRYMNNIMNYTLSLSKNSRARFLSSCDWNQPVLQAELVRLRRNLLDKMTTQEKEMQTECFICAEPLRISALPPSIVSTCLAFPAIISRLDSYLIALEACDELELVIRPDFALEAFTKDSDNTEEHRGQQIHFQRGMGKNYERLEFLGDCFLKMATSIALFSQNPNDDEFDYHVNRMCLICNKNLFNTAIKKQIYRYIRSRGFSRHIWYPDGLTLLHGKDHSTKLLSEGKHALGEKTIADVCEALIGASLLSGGPEHRFDMATKAVSALVDSPSHRVSCWKEYITLYTLPKYQTEKHRGSEDDLARHVEEELGYHFTYPRLLASAITHPSLPSTWGYRVPCYQRLEFLGDSLLDMVCVEDLFRRFPDRDPQWLSEHKMAMVSNKFLGALSVKLGFHRRIMAFSNPLQAQITHYVEEIETAQAESQGAVDYWVVAKDPPKCLPDMVEAYLGAIFVDSKFDFQVIEAFFERQIKPFFEDMSIYDTFANKHPTTFLHNKLTNEYGCTNYCLKAGELPTIDGAPATVLAAVIVHGNVISEARSSSSRYAKIKASEKALAVLDGLLPSEFCQKYRCDCKETKNSSSVVEIGTAI
ncbi:Dicer-like protein 1 [Aspergillus fumigatus]|nr:Dicer-like protein 1 [Aspergillus fumigatus]KAH1323558.1 Dicer-like protein 1 [Aspergillus fumigatus]KAH1387153.1 Dicer-like protein 1 [Aspergillus fumigatus]KAH1445766.1 Dicer-like protein 1 [Aspergillus fumigatus]KAH1572163.1 Dicer-like protein 1 [Aspergillus fumigatus]